MKTKDLDWARAAVRLMLVRLVEGCAAQLEAEGLAALEAAKACRKWMT